MGRVLVQQPGTNTAKALSETLPKNVIIVDEDLKELRLHDGVTPGGKIIGQNTGSGIPVGTIIPFAGNSVPQGYLLCDGSAISRTDYASLFAVIGTIYGAGDGNATFNLPALVDYVLRHTNSISEIGNRTNGKLPNITGQFSSPNAIYGNATKAFNAINESSEWVGSIRHTGQTLWLDFNAARSSSIYVDDINYVRPKSMTIRHFIKYI